MMLTKREFSEKLAQAALRGWFRNEESCKNMKETLNSRAADNVERVLDQLIKEMREETTPKKYAIQINWRHKTVIPPDYKMIGGKVMLWEDKNKAEEWVKQASD